MPSPSSHELVVNLFSNLPSLGIWQSDFPQIHHIGKPSAHIFIVVQSISFKGSLPVGARTDHAIVIEFPTEFEICRKSERCSVLQ